MGAAALESARVPMADFPYRRYVVADCRGRTLFVHERLRDAQRAARRFEAMDDIYQPVSIALDMTNA